MGGAGRPLAVALAFAFALGSGYLALPLLALDAGYGLADVGAFTAISAVGQLVSRVGLPWLLGRWPDRALVVFACILMAASYGVLVVSTDVVAFVVAQFALGTSRGFFWTASQTHVVRRGDVAVHSISRLLVASNVGAMVGPIVAGALASIAIELALAAGTAAALAGAALALGLRRLEPYAREPRVGEARLWRRPGVDVGIWASFTAGGWRALMSSYVPVVLSVAGLSPAVVGWLLGLADGAGIPASALLTRMRREHTRAVLLLGVAASAGGLALLPSVASTPVLAGIVLVLGGAGAIALTSLGAAVASDAVREPEQGDAIALTGAFRAAALLAAPAAVAAMLGVAGLTVAVTIAGAAMGLPALLLSRRLTRRSG